MGAARYYARSLGQEPQDSTLAPLREMHDAIQQGGNLAGFRTAVGNKINDDGNPTKNFKPRQKSSCPFHFLATSKSKNQLPKKPEVKSASTALLLGSSLLFKWRRVHHVLRGHVAPFRCQHFLQSGDGVGHHMGVLVAHQALQRRKQLRLGDLK